MAGRATSLCLALLTLQVVPLVADDQANISKDSLYATVRKFASTANHVATTLTHKLNELQEKAAQDQKYADEAWKTWSAAPNEANKANFDSRQANAVTSLASAKAAAELKPFADAISRYGVAKTSRFIGGKNRIREEVQEFRDAELEFNTAFQAYSKNPTPNAELQALLKAYVDIEIATQSGRDIVTPREVGRGIYQTREQERVAEVTYETWTMNGATLKRQEEKANVYYSVPIRRPLIASGLRYVGTANTPSYKRSGFSATEAKSSTADVGLEVYGPAWNVKWEQLTEPKNSQLTDLVDGHWFSTEPKFYYRGYVRFSGESETIAGFHYVADRADRPTRVWVGVFEEEPVITPSDVLKLPEDKGEYIKLSGTSVVLLKRPKPGKFVYLLFEKEIARTEIPSLRNQTAAVKEKAIRFVVPELSIIQLAPGIAVPPHAPQTAQN